MKAYLFHNEHQRESRLLAEALAVLPTVEVLDFMTARETYWFQGTPCVWIGDDTPQEEAWSKAIDVTLQDVQAALSRVRELRISGPSSCAPGEQVYTVTALDFDGNPASLPEDTALIVGDQSIPVTDDDPEVEITFSDPGIYTLTVTGTEAVSATLEVTVGG